MKKYLTLGIVTALLLGVNVTAAGAESPIKEETLLSFAKSRIVVAHRVQERIAERHRLVRLRHDRILERRERRQAAEAAAVAATVVSTPTSTPTGTIAASVPSGCLSDEQIAAYARGAGFPESVIPTMVYIAAHRGSNGESGGCPGAVNSSSGACGLWQIYPCPGPDALDPARNAELAYSKYESSGLSPWAM